MTREAPVGGRGAVQALVIDDSRAMRTILRRVLVQLGFEVREAEDGQAGLEQLEQGPLPDVALVDWNMPVLDGLGLVTAVRSRPDWNALPLVMVTTENDQRRVARALEAGADEYVVKPFTPGVIADRLFRLGVLHGEAAV